MDHQQQFMWAVTGLGGLTMIGVFWRMKPGFGPFNMRMVGIVLVATLAALLGLGQNSITAAMGILGAIAGYMFGVRDSGPVN